MIAAAFLVLLRPYSIQCAFLLLLLMLGTIATISFLCCWHRKLQKGRHTIKNVLGGRARSRGRTYAILRSHHFRSEGFRPSPRHLRRYTRARVEETKPPVEIPQSDQETPSSLRKRKIKKSSRVQPEFYQSVQVTPTRKPSSGTASYRCSMSSSADFSDDDDFSQKSGSASPAPGDTLPWNLPRHERCKRKSSGAAVLDPAERAVLRIADERDKVQKKTFTKWINQHLMKVRKHVNDLYEDLRDGHNLISLLEVLSGDTLPRERDFLKTLRLVSSSEACEYDQHEDVEDEDEDKGPREKGRMRFHRLQNVQIALDYLKKRQVKLVNIRNDDITDGNPKLTLGLIWTIILHFQISDIHVTGESEDMSAKEKLLLWSQQTTEGYGRIRCENFTTCWRDGRLFNAIIHKYRPDLIDMDTVAVQSNITNLENAFYVAEKLGVTRLLDPEDVDVSSPDEKSVITYVASMYDVFPKTPDGGEGISANDVEVKWIEYQNMVNYLIQWIRHHVVLMSERTFPNTVVELKALYQQYLQFKEKEIPPRETEKSKIKHLYTFLEPWIQFGRIKLDQGYHPNDIEKEWGKLIIAMFEREKAIRPEIERLEMLQQLANRVQRDSLGCEDKLILARSALQADAKRMESGIQLQNEAEITGYLIECENLLRQQLVDVQSLVDGKYYQADQLVQRVASLRDELLALRNEFTSLYSKGRMFTNDQTKLMISGISQSLSSGFSQNLNPVMNSTMSHSMTPSLTPTSLTPGMSHGFNSHLTAAMTPPFSPNYNSGLIQNYATGMNTNALQSLKHIQIKKPLQKSSLADQNLPEEVVNSKFVQDLLSWIEEMQVQLDRAEWGSDLSSIEGHLETHKHFHNAVEEFESSLKEAKMSELQITGIYKANFAESLYKLESQYSKLLNSSRNRQKHLDMLHSFVSRATRELIWLNEKEEEEVAYDWSERNQNIQAKKDYHGELMRELDQKEEIIKSVQDIAEQMLLQNHPARSTIESYRAAMQTQWNWILQLCHCVEQHIRQNSAYFEYFNDAKNAAEYLKSLKDAILRKYSCDKSTSLHKVEDLLQESMEEKEQLLQYKSTVASLVGRAKAIIQLKPRNPDNPLKASIQIRAICDYKQIEITIYKDDECILASNSHRAKWKVISPTGNEAMVPSVCFTVPPPNKEAVDSANRIEQMYQSVLTLWHESHINMKSTVSWHYLMNEIEGIRSSKVSTIKTLLPGEHQQVLSNLKSHFDEFLEDSQESKIFSVSDITQLEREVNVCKLYYEELLQSAEREEQEESIYNLYVSEIRNFRLRMENCEDRLIRQIRTPLDRDDLHESVLRIAEQEKLKKELDHLKADLSTISEKCEEFFSQAATSPSIETLRTELNIVIQNMNQVYSMSSIYLEKLKTINLVLKNTQGAETIVKLYETRLCEEDAVTADRNGIDKLETTLKLWRSEVDEQREVFHALEDELQKAKNISDQMLKVHKERDLDFDWHKEKADQLAERWQNIHSQIENRLRDLDGISKSLKYYKESYGTLDSWISQIEETQSMLQENLPENSKALAKQLDQQKMLISEIEMKQSKMDECQKYSEQFSSAIKDYELQLMTYRAMVDSHQKSPMKRRRIQSSSDAIVQEFMGLRTRYTALITLITQLVKFSGETLKRMEEEEKSLEEEKKEHVKKAGEILNWVSKVTQTLSKEGGQASSEKTPISKSQISCDEIAMKQEEISDALQTLQLLLAKHNERLTDEEREEIEKQVKALQESQSSLSKEYKRQQKEEKDLVDKLVEQKVDKVVSGTIDETTGTVHSVYQSIVQGFVDYETGMRLLEMQLIVSGLVSPGLKICFDIEEAKNHALIDEQIAIRLQDLSDAKNITSSLSTVDFPIIGALNQGLISESIAIKMIDILLSCGCLYVCGIDEHLNLNKLFQRNLISAVLFSKLIDRQKAGKDLIDPITAEKVNVTEIIQRCVTNKQTGMKFLPVNVQDTGKITLKSGRKINVLRAAHEGILEREIMFRMLGAQIFSGGIIDPDSGRRLTLEESLEKGLIDQGTVCGILTQQVQNGGIVCPSTGKYLTVDEAVQCNLISYSSALLVLEAQRGFIGLIWPDTSEIFPISTSLQQGMISNDLAEKILRNRQKIAGLYIPETSEIIHLDVAAQLGVIENNTATVLSNIQLHDKMPNIDVLEPTCKHALKCMPSYESHASPVEELSEKKSSDTEEPLTHNPEHTKQLFYSYLMINSYIDANTGERLLLFDGDLDEAASMLLESEHIVHTTSITSEEQNFDSKYDEFSSHVVPGLDINDTGMDCLDCEENIPITIVTDLDENLFQGQQNNSVYCDLDGNGIYAEQHKYNLGNIENTGVGDQEKIAEGEHAQLQELQFVDDKQNHVEWQGLTPCQDDQTSVNSNSHVLKPLESSTPKVGSMHSHIDENSLDTSKMQHDIVNEEPAEPHHSMPGNIIYEETITTLNVQIGEQQIDTKDTIPLFNTETFADELETQVSFISNISSDNKGTTIEPHLSDSSCQIDCGIGYETPQHKLSYSDGYITPTNSEHERFTLKITPTNSEHELFTLNTVAEFSSDSMKAEICNNTHANLTHTTNSNENYECSPENVLKHSCGTLQIHSDDTSDLEEKGSDDEIDFISQYDIISNKFQTIGGNIAEDRDLTDSSSDDDTSYYNENDIEKAVVARDHQFLETIIEEDLESIMCSEERTSPVTDNVLVMPEVASLVNLVQDSCKGDEKEDEPEVDNKANNFENGSHYLINEEIEDEFTESCFSETDIECFVTDETNTDEDYETELSTNEQSIFNNTCIFDPSQESEKSLTNSSNTICSLYQANNSEYAEYVSLSTSTNVCCTELDDEDERERPCSNNNTPDSVIKNYPTIETATLECTENGIVTQKTCDKLQTGEEFNADDNVCLSIKSIDNLSVFSIIPDANPEVSELCKSMNSESNTLETNVPATEIKNSSVYAPNLDDCLRTDDKTTIFRTNENVEEIIPLPEKQQNSDCVSNPSPIHIENLSTIFDSLLHKAGNDVLELNVATDVSETLKNTSIKNTDPKSEDKDRDLASYLRGCASILQANQETGCTPCSEADVIFAENKLDSTTDTNNLGLNNGVPEFQDQARTDRDVNNQLDGEQVCNYVEFGAKEGNMRERTKYKDNSDLSDKTKEYLVESKLKEIKRHTADETQIGHHSTACVYFSQEEKILQSEPDYPDSSTTDVKEVKNNSHAIFGLSGIDLDENQLCPNQQVEKLGHIDNHIAYSDTVLVQEPNRPKLISSQLEQIFYVPPDSENKNKIEELLININKGLYPSEMVSYSSKTHSSERQDNNPTMNAARQSDTFAQAECALKSKHAQNSDTLPSKYDQKTDDQKTQPNPKDVSTTVEAEECLSSDMLSMTLSQCSQKLCEHLTVIQDLKFQLDSLPSISDNLETLKIQLEQTESFVSRLNVLSADVKKDLKATEPFLMSVPGDLATEHLRELNDCLAKALALVCDMSSDRAKQIASSVDTEMSKLTVSYQELLNRLQNLSDWIQEKHNSVDVFVNSNDMEMVKQSLKILKELGTHASVKKTELETTAFDIQFLISEHAQDLSAIQSKQLLRLLNTTQRSFQEAHKKIASQIESLKSALVAAQDLSDQKDAEVQLQEHKEKLQEIGHLLTQTENRLIGQQDTFSAHDSPADLKLHQNEYQELQKDMHAGASELAEIVKNTEKFLQDYGDKLSPEDRAVIEQKLKEAKSKFDLLSKRAEESKKQLDNALTSAIKKETEKSAAVEQLEESKNKIESLLDWLSCVDKEAVNGNNVSKMNIKQNGTNHQDQDLNSLLDGIEEVNGNLIQTDGKEETVNVLKQDKEDLSSQYQRAKAQHDKIVSQHQAVIIATQSAQALLEKQGLHLSTEEKAKLQKDISDLKAQYETALSDSERKMKVIQNVQEELEKFSTDCIEFENWLQESQCELEELESGPADFAAIDIKFQRQKSFSEDVISHKGDLRYITISGQRVLDAAKSCNKDDDNNNVNTLETCKMVQERLDTASEKFKSLHSKCNVLGNNLKDLSDKCQHYQDASSSLLKRIEKSESFVNKKLSEPIASDTKNVQRQLEDTKVLCEQVSAHQADVEKLKKAAEVLMDSKGGLSLNKDEIQKPLDDIVGRYNTLSQSVNDWNENLQVTLTRSLSVQDGLNEMLDWMNGVERDFKDQHQVPLNSSSIQEIITKNNILEQDISNRQSSINTINDKVQKFVETADPSTASSLQAKMNELFHRFSKAGELAKEHTAQMEDLKTKVELFEKLSDKVNSFLDQKLQSLTETGGPGKDVTELSQYMQETNCELADHKKNLEDLQMLVEEICVYGIPGDKALALEKVKTMLKSFKDLEETVKAKEEDVSSCQNEMDAFKSLVQSLKKWHASVIEEIPAASSTFCVEELAKHLKKSKSLQEEWSQKGPEVQKVNSNGAVLCNLISTVTSPAKVRASGKSGRTFINGTVTSDAKEQLTNKELVNVEKEISDVNEGYQHLGDLLKEKVSELEKWLSQMQQVQEETDALMTWLSKMQVETAEWEHPTDSVSVKAQIEQHKRFVSGIKQKEKSVEMLKDKLKDLLLANPDAPESSKWKEMLDKIDSLWQDINKMASERQQTLEESSNDLTQFQTAEAQLKQWLTEKELMASVLGPLSIDPNMLKTQKQQVQILLKEFDARKQQYEQFSSAGQRILNRPCELPSSDEVVKEQLASVACKWESLTGQLNDRCDRIEQAIVKSTHYQNNLKGLSEKLSSMSTTLSSNMVVSSHPDAVKQKLQTAKQLQEDLSKEKNNIEETKVLCQELSDLVAEEYMKAELNRQLDTVVKPFVELEEKAGYHVDQLQMDFASSQKFHHLSEDLQSWIQTKGKEQNEAAPISAKLDILDTLITQQTEVQNALKHQLSTYEKITAEAENLLQKTKGDEKANLQSEQSILKRNWEAINKQVLERKNNLLDCQQKATKYKELVENIQPWIEECQQKLSEFTVSVDLGTIESSVGQVKVLQKNVDKQRGMMETLNSAAESLLNCCQTDKEEITEQNKNMNSQVEELIDNLHIKRDTLEKFGIRLKEFHESVKDTEKQLAVAQEHLDTHNSLGPQGCSNKHLTIMQAQQKVLQILEPEIDTARSLAQQLVVDASDAEGVTELLLQAESLQQKHHIIHQEIEEKCSFLETKLQGIGHFQNSIREMFSQFTELDDELDSMAPVGRDLNKLQGQKQEISNFLKKLSDLITTNENANKTCKKMLETESSPDLIGIRRDLEALNKQCNKLLDRAKSREEETENIITRTEEFYSTLKQFVDQLKGVEEHEESQGAVGMETDVINHQLNIFMAFQKEETDPLQTRLQEVNRLGQGLVQSAAKNTSTENLEHDLEEVNVRWNTLNNKVAQRAAQLQEALLHCGRFQDALESLLSWLTDTEELIASQKPPSAEFKVVKAQLQEQKLLQRLLNDRKPTVDVIKREGEKIAGSADQADKEKILKQLNALEHRWDELLKKAEIRTRQLDGILVVAEQFHDSFEPISEWLTSTEKKLAISEPIGTQTAKLLQQISQQKALEDDITAHNKSLHQSLSIGQALKSLSSREDKEMVQEKLDTYQTRYLEIQDKSCRRCELLHQAYCNAQIFGDDEVELMNWLTEAHDKLSKLTVQDYSTDVLTRQHTELLLLQEDIMLRKQNVDQAIQNGVELLKQTTGDEVVIIQEKLDGIKLRYAEITKLSSKVSKILDQALHLATQFHSTHEELSRWLDTVEVELKEYETQTCSAEDLTIVQERKKELKQEAKASKALLDSLNDVSSALLELVPWRAREGLDRMVTEDNERYRLVNDTLTQMVEEIDAARVRSQQFEQAVNAEYSWTKEAENKLRSLGHIRLEQDQTTAQLQVQKAFTMDILRHKDSIDELIASADDVMNAFNEEEKQSMKNKLKNLVKKYDETCHLNAERNLQLERAVSLVNQFWETYEELWPWLTETENAISQLPVPALDYDTLKQQQEDIRQLRELIAEHKPHIDKMNKTGPQLLDLSPEEGFFIQEKYVLADTLYSEIKEVVKKRAINLDEAIFQSAQFHDKIDPTLESLQRIAERLRQPPSISAECEKIKEQLSENKNVSVELEKLQPVYETLKKRGEEMIARSEGADKDISAKVVQDKLDQMVFVWEDIQALTEEREAQLLDVLELAEKFWCDHYALIATFKDTQDLIRELDGPGVDPSVVKQQQETAELIKEEIDGFQDELDAVITLGSELISACGEPDKPVVNKNIDELTSAWDILNKTWKERVEKLDEAMQAAVQYQDGLQALYDWVDISTLKVESMPPIGTDLETVKQQIVELKQFKTNTYQQQIELERLNHQKELLLKKVTDENDKQAVEDPLSELKLLWHSLEDKIINRQHKLEGALLALGPFQHALDELMTWMTHTEGLLNEQKPVGGDPKAIEIELAKHHVLQNDVLAHKSTVETLRKAGNDLVESSAGEEASSLNSRLESLNQRWQIILDKTEQRMKLLDSALFQAQGFHGEIEDMHQWLTDIERQLLASKPVGGLPETAREQLNSLLELCSVFEVKEDIYKRLMQRSRQMMERCTDDPEANIDQDIINLKEKWESVDTKLSERKAKLEEALQVATGFHNSLQDFINWLTQAEQILTMASPPSLILDTILFQIDEHKVFVTEVNSHRDQIMELDKTGTHLKYFSQKQDVVIIKNLLISVQSRWENVVQRSLERGRTLDDARKRSKQFHEAFDKLMEWLEESEKSLDSELEIANDPDKIKTQLAKHKEFQKTLGGKHTVYDTTARSGRSLKEKATLADDIQKLDDMLSEIRDKWDTVCGKSIERQNKLEEALLISGQFTDALQALIDWLYRVEPQLAEDQPVHGDLDIVMHLIDNHKVFQKELGKRSSNIQALKRSARELGEGSHEDSSWVKAQMQELGTRWETVCNLSVSKQTRLEEALHKAESFHAAVHALLEWLADAEQALRFHGILPDDEDSLHLLIEQHKEFMRKVEEKRSELNKGASMGEAILAICHQDSITTIKHWITIIRARFEEVLTWAKQHQHRLAVALDDLIAKKELLESLLAWLQWSEMTLNEKDKEDIPQDLDEVKALIEEHQIFMEEMTQKQPDVDKVTKTYKRKAESTSVQSQIPVLGKGRGGWKRSPTPSLYPSGSQTSLETKNPRVNLLVSKWQQVWLLALERRRKLNDALDRLEELREFANFDFDVWRKKYMRWMNHKKSRVMDFFRRIDKDQDGKITRQEFIEGILSSKFPTSRLEMSAVADIFDRDGDGYIDYYEFVAALHPNKDAYKPITDADKIEDEVTRQVAKCKCAKRFQVEQIGENKYRFFLGNQFGDSQQLRLVRILRSTVMVRVGGGWMALDEFLVKNDPCRAKGRTNVELREKFMLPEGASQSMTPFRPKGRRSRPSSRGASPNRSNSSPNIQASPSLAASSSTPKTPLHLTRNYGKPWLTNSKTSTPCKSPESPEYQLSSLETTPIQGSKLRLPGYLSGKEFNSIGDSNILTTAATKVRTQFADYRKTPSRAGSKAGSRSSSRRGSDASDFDISEIQSVCSDMPETLLNSSRPSPRASPRSGTGKPSKIPTPQRRSPMNKPNKLTKR
ncbi:dystonin isoform X3 [Xenopus laevis]|uniref:Dystonin n=2 Tax=Xenopus laevis TaxID=8355 RepID=A0A8J0V8D1_XENLA|nr:dystonin isoform X3 [Xenopus laevis]